MFLCRIKRDETKMYIFISLIYYYCPSQLLINFYASFMFSIQRTFHKFVIHSVFTRFYLKLYKFHILTHRCRTFQLNENLEKFHRHDAASDAVIIKNSSYY